MCVASVKRDVIDYRKCKKKGIPSRFWHIQPRSTHTSNQVKNDFHYNSNANWDDVNLNHINHWPKVNWLFEARKGLPTEQKRIERTIRVTIGKVITRLTWIPKRAEKYRLKIYNWVWGQNGYQLIAPRSCHFPQLTLARCKAYIYIFSFFFTSAQNLISQRNKMSS